MKNRDIARKIVSGFIKTTTSFSFEEQLIELASVNDSDEVLLEHIDIMIEILEAAKKEIEENK